MKTLYVISIIILPVLLFTSRAYGGKVMTPDSLEGGTIITVSQSKKMLDSANAKFFDMRKALNYGKGHIPGAVSLPYKDKINKVAGFYPDTVPFDLKKLPRDKKASIVFYSHGPSGWKSYVAAKVAIKNGYSNVMWMRDGFGLWQKKSFPVEK